MQYYVFCFSASTAKKETPKQPTVQAYSPRSKMGTLLPDFPNVEELKLPDEIESEKVRALTNPVTPPQS